MNIATNDQWLDRTVNKDVRPGNLTTPPDYGYVGVICHETGNGSGNAASTLDWNLRRFDPRTGDKIESSYHYLIGRDGTIYHYVDERKYVAWHAGSSSWNLGGTAYSGYGINTHWLGVEVDGADDGTPATAAQLASFGRLAVSFHDTYGIPIDNQHYVMHSQIAPVRKVDAKGYTVEEVIEAARGEAIPTPATDYALLWGNAAPYNPDWGFETTYRSEYDAGRPLGRVLTVEFGDPIVFQGFEHGALRLDKAAGVITILR